MIQTFCPTHLPLTTPTSLSHLNVSPPPLTSPTQAHKSFLYSLFLCFTLVRRGGHANLGNSCEFFHHFAAAIHPSSSSSSSQAMNSDFCTNTYTQPIINVAKNKTRAARKNKNKYTEFGRNHSGKETRSNTVYQIKRLKCQNASTFTHIISNVLLGGNRVLPCTTAENAHKLLYSFP